MNSHHKNADLVRQSAGSGHACVIKRGRKGESEKKKKKARSLACPALFHRERRFVTPRQPHVVQRARLSARLSPIVVANIGRQARVWINSWSSYCGRSTSGPEFPRYTAPASVHTKAATAAAADMSFRSRQTSMIEVPGKLSHQIFAFAYATGELPHVKSKT